MHQFTMPHRARRPVAIWLVVVVVLLLSMIIVGGLTRLTNSGLSITEWKPVSGVIPPISSADWQAEFNNYKKIPQYRLENQDMTLSQFKSIFWWEWSHRLLGRTIGFVVLIPLIAFWIKGYMGRGLKIRLGMLFVLGGLQGLIGWWMVYSGLGSMGDLISVSPYRLVTHFGMALILLGITLWTFLDVASADKRRMWNASLELARLSWALLLLVFVQLLLGGMVAANDGGKIANTWPLMGQGFFPQDWGMLHPFWRNLFEDGLIAQFFHRMGAYAILLFSLFIFFRARRESAFELHQQSNILMFAVLVQVGLGIWTLLAVAPVSLSSAHQYMALIVFLAALNMTHASSRYYLSS